MAEANSAPSKPDDAYDDQDNAHSELDSSLFVWTTENLLAATKQLKGQWYSLQDHQQIKATRIITDTRKIEAGDIFLAIVGENFDGHQFVEAAAKKGAVAAIVSQPNDTVSLPQLKVADTRLAFGKVAAYRRQQHPDLKVIAITGSSGKTTVKEMLRSIFIAQETKIAQESKIERASQAVSNTAQSQQASSFEPGHSTLVTRGNLNNDYGVPMMLLELSKQHQYAVLELGANHVGEIAYTADMVKPDVACILNIGTAHLGEFGGRDNIAKTKAEIYQSLTADSTAVVPADDDYTQTLTDSAQAFTSNIMHFGWQSQVANKDLTDVYATDVQAAATHCDFNLHLQSEQMPVTLPMAGLHNVSNALAAAACASAVGIDIDTIVAGLNQSKSIKGRLGRQSLGRHLIIDDTYNANPNSMRAAADVLAAQEGTKILVLGDIGELGDAARNEHYKLGQAISDKAIDILLCVGEFAPDTVAGAQNNDRGNNSAHTLDAHPFETKAELYTHLKSVLSEQSAKDKACTLLFKGSRSATMETLIEDLVQDFAKDSASF